MSESRVGGTYKGKCDCPFNSISFVPNLDYKMHQIKHRLNTEEKKKKTLLLSYVSWEQLYSKFKLQNCILVHLHTTLNILPLIG